MICSPNQAVDNTRWPKVKPNRAHKAETIVIIPSGDGRNNIMVAKLANGSFVSSRDISKAAYMPGSWPWMDGTIKALVALGAITQADADEHKKRCDEVNAKSKAHYAAFSLASALAEAGLSATTEQQAFIDANIKERY
jgi:hypothetical protein